MIIRNSDIFDLEQEIMACWNVIDDLDMITAHFIDSPEYTNMPPDIADSIMNKYFGLKEVYDVKFKRLWATFEVVCKEHHRLRKERGDFDDAKD